MLIVSIAHLLWFLVRVRHNKLIKRRPLPTVLVGNTPKINELKAILADRTDFGFRVDRHLKTDAIKSAISSIDPKRTQVIFCSLKEFSDREIVELQKFTHNHFIQLKFLADIEFLLNQATIQEYIDYLPVISIRETPLEKESNRYVKRLLDITVTLLVILGVLIWLYPVLWVLIRVTSKGPAIFPQKRNGVNNKVFHCYKFRSMRLNNSTSQATQNDNRITPIGKFIRKTSIDELPQFFNVLLGDMSVVGPRPHMEAHNKKFAEKTDTFAFRHVVKPGITGLAQTKGYRGEIKSDEDIVNRIKYDIFYIKNWTLLLDIKIIFQTGWLVIFGDKKAY
jgi:putative colanic acid biosynthesis UDP-glucose lipid carrier transferase